MQHWFYSEEDKRLAQGIDPSDAETVVENLNADEVHLAGEDGRHLAARRLPTILQEFGFGPPGPARERFAVSLLQRAMLEGVLRSRDRYEARSGERAYDMAFAGVTAAAPPPNLPRRPGVTFSELCSRYLAAPERAAISPKTKLKYQGMFRVLCELLGADRAAGAITREECRQAQAELLALPANAAQRYRGLTARAAAEKAKRDGLPPMHPKSVGNHLDLLAAVFRWGAREGIVQLAVGNPAEALNTATAKTVVAVRGEKRRPFTTDELRRIFAAPLYVGCKDDENRYAEPGPSRPRRGRFWVPLLSLWAGLRLNEAAQLHAADVVEDDGIPLLVIQASAEGQRLKTSAAARRVPVHPELQRIGFMQYATQLRRAGETRLFTDLKAGALGNFSDPFSKWFARFLDKAGVSSPGAVFHSFRHNFRDRLREAGVPREAVRALGWWADTDVDAAYGGGFSARTLASHLSRVEYPNLDLSHLHWAGD